MTDEPTKTISDFEAKLNEADKAVASFAADDRTLLATIRRVLGKNPTLIPTMVLLVSVCVFGLIANNFMTPGTLSTIMKQITVVSVVAIAQTLVILTAGIDLSVSAMLVLSSIVMGKLAVDLDMPPWLAIIYGLGAGTLMGLVNGVLVTQLKLPPFIVTLGTLSIFNALKLAYSGSQSVRGADITAKAPELLTFKGVVEFGGAQITYGVIAMLVLALIVWFMLNKTAWGRHVHAIGDDPEAASLSGIKVNDVLVSVYAFAGFICAFGGWVAIGRVGSITPIGFEDVNLTSITAVVIGGTSLFGGRGSLIGSVLGAIIVGVFNTGLSLSGVDDYWQEFAVGCLVIAAVALDQWLRRATK
jgi:fructose transport system permease protein